MPVREAPHVPERDRHTRRATSSLVRVIEPLMTQITVPVNEEIGPVPETETTTKKNESSVRH